MRRRANPNLVHEHLLHKFGGKHGRGFILDEAVVSVVLIRGVQS